MTPPLPDELPDAVRHYLGRARYVIDLVAAAPDHEALLRTRIATDAFDTGFNLAIALQFAARTLCPPAGISVPDIPEDFSARALAAYHETILSLIAPIRAEDLSRRVTHTAGEARLSQPAGDYVLRFAFPNMIFHFTMAYAALRQAGLDIGKADFDGLHAY